MKNMKKILALLVAVLMIVASMSVAFAGTNTAHTITVTTNGDGVHEYSAFQIFKGNLDAKGETLSNIVWGDDISGKVAELKTAIAADDTIKDIFKNCGEDAAKFAEALGEHNNAATAKAFADAVSTALGNATTTHKASTTNKVAEIEVVGDGYYFIKDTTASLAKDDTYSRFMLKVVGDIAVTAKDTKLNPDKEIVKEDETSVTPTKKNDSAIGDVIRYNVTLTVPDTTEYKKNFWLHMNDTLETGLTYLGNMAITIDTDPVTTLTGTGDNANYTATVTNADDSAFTAPDTALAAVSTAGGQKIKVVFNNFKQYVEANNLKDKTITIAYDVVLNKNATMGVNSNDNTVYFDYSNNPNSEYDGSDWNEENPKGTTPSSTTQTFTTTLELDKEDGKTKQALEGAEFLLTGTAWHNVVVTGEEFRASTATTLADGETIEKKNDANVVYYKLKDGSYTTTVKNDQTAALYEESEATYIKVIMNKVVKEAKNVNLTLVTDASGHIIVDGIEQGTYTLKETKAPTGYNLDETEYQLVIGWDTAEGHAAAGGFFKDTGSNDKFSMTDDGAKFSIVLDNFSGSTLPSTGGMGTTLFYIGGGILVLAAVILLVTKRRMSAND